MNKLNHPPKGNLLEQFNNKFHGKTFTVNEVKRFYLTTITKFRIGLCKHLEGDHVLFFHDDKSLTIDLENGKIKNKDYEGVAEWE